MSDTNLTHVINETNLTRLSATLVRQYAKESTLGAHAYHSYS